MYVIQSMIDRIIAIIFKKIKFVEYVNICNEIVNNILSGEY